MKILMLFAPLSLLLAEDIFFGEKFETGAYKTGKGDNDIFYWLFYARIPNHPAPPLLIWIEGGPGCSGMYSPLSQNGAYQVSAEPPFKVNRNPFSWNNYYDFMTIDSPSGVGFSKLTTESCTDSYCSIIDVYTFLTKFFIAHPQYQGRDFYLTGQSYAGHYIPLLAEHIIRQSNSMINLKGIAIGNGWYNGIHQIPGFSSFAFENKLISWWKYAFSNLVIFVADILLKAGLINIGGYLGDPYLINLIAGEKFSVYDIRRKVYPDYETNIIKYFKLPEVIERLNISGRPYFIDQDNDICNSSLEFTYSDDFDPMDNSLRTVINANIKVLLFTGDKDFICNLDSQEMWLSKFEWEGQSHIVNDEYADWKLNGTSYGKYKKYKNLMHLVIYNASHMSSIEQPYCTNVMINQFVDGQIGL